MKFSKLLIILSLCATTLLTCKNNDKLTGTWLRNDSNATTTYKLLFKKNGVGAIITTNTTETGTTSGINPFSWSTSGKTLSIQQDNTTIPGITSNFSYTKNGHLKLSAFSNVAFIKE